MRAAGLVRGPPTKTRATPAKSVQAKNYPRIFLWSTPLVELRSTISCPIAVVQVMGSP